MKLIVIWKIIVTSKTWALLNINKSDRAAKGLHLKERGSSKLVTNFTEYVYWTFVIGNSIFNEIKQCHLVVQFLWNSVSETIVMIAKQWPY